MDQVGEQIVGTIAAPIRIGRVGCDDDAGRHRAVDDGSVGGGEDVHVGPLGLVFARTVEEIRSSAFGLG